MGMEEGEHRRKTGRRGAEGCTHTLSSRVMSLTFHGRRGGALQSLHEQVFKVTQR